MDICIESVYSILYTQTFTLSKYEGRWWDRQVLNFNPLILIRPPETETSLDFFLHECNMNDEMGIKYKWLEVRRAGGNLGEI